MLSPDTGYLLVTHYLLTWHPDYDIPPPAPSYLSRHLNMNFRKNKILFLLQNCLVFIRTRTWDRCVKVANSMPSKHDQGRRTATQTRRRLWWWNFHISENSPPRKTVTWRKSSSIAFPTLPSILIITVCNSSEEVHCMETTCMYRLESSAATQLTYTGQEGEKWTQTDVSSNTDQFLL